MKRPHPEGVGRGTRLGIYTRIRAEPSQEPEAKSLKKRTPGPTGGPVSGLGEREAVGHVMEWVGRTTPNPKNIQLKPPLPTLFRNPQIVSFTSCLFWAKLAVPASN